jgi:hypothetical protein
MENSPMPVPPDVFDVVLTSVLGSAQDDGRFTVTYDNTMGAWVGDTVFACSAPDAFNVHLEVRSFGSTALRCTWSADSSLCGSSGTMVAEGAIVNGQVGQPGTVFPINLPLPNFDSPPILAFWFDGVVV